MWWDRVFLSGGLDFGSPRFWSNIITEFFAQVPWFGCGDGPGHLGSEVAFHKPLLLVVLTLGFCLYASQAILCLLICSSGFGSDCRLHLVCCPAASL